MKRAKSTSLSVKLTLWLSAPVLIVTLLLCFHDLAWTLDNRADPDTPFTTGLQAGIPYQADAETDQLLYNLFHNYYDQDRLTYSIAVDDSGNIVFRDHLGFARIEKKTEGRLKNSGYTYGDTDRFLVVDGCFPDADVAAMAYPSEDMLSEIHAVGRDDGFYFYASSLTFISADGRSVIWTAPEACGTDQLTLYANDEYSIEPQFPEYVNVNREYSGWFYDSTEAAIADLGSSVKRVSERWSLLLSILHSVSEEPILRREDAFRRDDRSNAFSSCFWQEVTTETISPDFFTNTGLHFYTRVYETPLPVALRDHRAELLFRLTLAAVLLLTVYLLTEYLIAAPLRRCIMEAENVVNAESRFLAEDASRPDEIGALAQTLKKAESAFQKKWDTERALEHKRQDFVAAASHDLKTPLALISGYVEAVQQEIDPAENARYLDAIEREAAKMNRLVLAMLDYTRLERMDGLKSGRRENLSELLGGWLDDAAPLFTGRALERSLPERLFIRCDAELFRRAVDNLLSNAAKFTPEGGTVRVTLETRSVASLWDALNGSQFRLTVENEGEPIPADDLERIFEMFYRTDRARTRGSVGNGIGLASAKRICELHGFTLCAENTPDGVKFRIEG